MLSSYVQELSSSTPKFDNQNCWNFSIFNFMLQQQCASGLIWFRHKKKLLGIVFCLKTTSSWKLFWEHIQHIRFLCPKMLQNVPKDAEITWFVILSVVYCSAAISSMCHNPAPSSPNKKFSSYICSFIRNVDVTHMKHRKPTYLCLGNLIVPTFNSGD